MKLFIISGASKGLGLSLSELAINENHIVIAIARTKTINHPHLFHISHDLSKPKGLELKLDKILQKIDLKKIKAVHLINNAAAIEPIGEVHQFQSDDIESHLKINLLAPILLTRWLMQNFNKRKFPIIVANITSGAAFHSIVNWSLYCTTKSGLNMFTNCLSLDYQTKKNFKAISFSPGVMDTNMQATIRKQTKKSFANIEKFRQLKQQNLLLSPDRVAMGLYELLQDPDKINKNHYDIRELYS